jgi:hypothetical protein
MPCGAHIDRRFQGLCHRERATTTGRQQTPPRYLGGAGERRSHGRFAPGVNGTLLSCTPARFRCFFAVFTAGAAAESVLFACLTRRVHSIDPHLFFTCIFRRGPRGMRPIEGRQ